MKEKWFHLRDEEIVTEFMDDKISEMEAIRRIMRKIGCDIGTAKIRMGLDIKTLNS